MDSRQQYDSDLDGFGDSIDAFPYDSRENVDSDFDGVGDKSDLCPNGGADNSGRIGCFGDIGFFEQNGALGYILVVLIAGMFSIIGLLFYQIRRVSDN